MGWLPEKETRGMTALKALAIRDSKEKRKIFWNPHKYLLWCYCGNRNTLALFLTDDNDARMLPEKGCVMYPSTRGRIYVGEDEAPPNPNEAYADFIKKAGGKKRRFEPIEPDAPMEQYLEWIREITQRRIKKTALFPFKDLSFDLIELRESGVRLLKVNSYQIIFLDKPFRRKLKDKIPKSDISGILKEIT